MGLEVGGFMVNSGSIPDGRERCVPRIYVKDAAIITCWIRTSILWKCLKMSMINRHYSSYRWLEE